MSLSSSQLDAFFVVSQILNFTKAAEKLNITQSALSQRILNLEHELGATLFIRDRASLKLTETATHLVRYCQMKDAMENEFLSQARSTNPNELAGNIKIGGFSSITSSIIIPLMSGFIRKHPGVRLSVQTKELDELTNMLKRSEIDYMILDDRLQREELERIMLGDELNVLVECKSYSGPDVYLDHDENDETTINYLKKFKHSTKNIKRNYLDDIHGIISGVKHGLGRAVVPLHLIKDEKNIVVINSKDILEVPVYLYFFQQPFYSRLHKVAVNEITENFRYWLGTN